MKLKGVQENISLKPYTTFKVGGSACYFFQAKTKKDIVLAIREAKKENLPFFVLSGGSNILVSEQGFNGLVIKIETSGINLSGNELLIEAGTLMSEITDFMLKNSLSGFEWAAGIPGTVGGAIRGNAGAFAVSMGDITEKVEAFDPEKNETAFYKKEDCGFLNKQSVFKEKGLVILSCILKMEKGEKGDIEKKTLENINYRKEKHPLDFPSAGCVFKNPKGYSAGLLIAKAGLAGKEEGGAQISEKHSNFVINKGTAKAEDVIKLASLMKEKVKEKFNITLEEEIQRVGFKNENNNQSNRV